MAFLKHEAPVAYVLRRNEMSMSCRVMKNGGAAGGRKKEEEIGLRIIGVN